jgi:hypothetical protein
MNDMHYIGVGFAILSKYDSTGEVNVNQEPTLFAGPGEMERDDFCEEDRTNLEANFWHFDEMISRWGYGL